MSQGVGTGTRGWGFLFPAEERVTRPVGGRISQKSFIFWTRAARRPLWLAPEKEDSDDTSFVKASKSKCNGKDKVLGMKKGSKEDVLTDAQDFIIARIYSGNFSVV